MDSRSMCDECDNSFDCVKPCDEVIDWVDLGDECRKKDYKPTDTTPSDWESQLGTMEQTQKRRASRAFRENFNKDLDFGG